MQFARDEGEASGHARYRMSSISREMDGIKAKMNKDKYEKNLDLIPTSTSIASVETITPNFNLKTQVPKSP